MAFSFLNIMKENKKLNQWLWRWHFIAGIITLPFVLLLAITGGIYLFKDNVETPIRNEFKQIENSTEVKASFQNQLEIVTEKLGKKPDGLIIPNTKNETTEFVSGRFSHKKSIYINPYTKEIKGDFSPKDTWMYTVRKLHGELLGGKIGTKIIELVASWMVVLILTGIYIFWPKGNNLSHLIRVRFNKGKHVLFKDLHSVIGFWISLLLLLTLAGGFPWTDVVGSNFKTLQKVTNTGFPKEWFGRGFKSEIKGAPLKLDQMLLIAKNQNLDGEVTLTFPKHKKGVFSIANKTFPLANQQKIHFDQYSGKIVKALNWSDVGILMRGRMWLMAFHQGEFGTWNFIVMLFVATLLAFISIAGLLSYINRKKPGSWSIPQTPKSFKVGYGVLALIVLLGLLFPLFGISVLLIIIGTFIKTRLSK